uniref:Cysteine rich secretory protein LCCL domain containing 1 n=1 Tax=Propithecus coquereli TaxID=379532 RepID=A0A2K6G8A2_PROCO
TNMNATRIAHSDVLVLCVLIIHRGNWWGHAPYKHGRPCSACPPSFGGGCRENLCYKEGSDRYYPPREEETNEIERQQSQVHDTHVRTRSDDSNRNEVISTQQMLSSICRAAVHAGVVRNHGGYVDVMPVDKRKTYVASFQNGIFSESLQNPPGGKAFRVFAVV